MSSIVNLKQYDVVLTTSFEFKYGISGHLYEMIDYYHAIKTYTTLSPCILLTDGTTTAELQRAVSQKYTDVVISNVVESKHPRVILAKNLVIVDGSPRLRGADIFADNVFLFRCSESDFSVFSKFACTTYLLQDFEVYDERYDHTMLKVVDYKKKILFSHYKEYTHSATDTAMFYLTTSCRSLTNEELSKVITKYGFPNNIILTDNPALYNIGTVYQVPVESLWDKFSTYIYTSIPRQIDCSSRFILECLHYGKDVVYDIDYHDRALEVRKKDGLHGTSLLPSDSFLSLLNEQIKHTTS